jgi:hypothetical protein
MGKIRTGRLQALQKLETIGRIQGGQLEIFEVGKDACVIPAMVRQILDHHDIVDPSVVCDWAA